MSDSRSRARNHLGRPPLEGRDEERLRRQANQSANDAFVELMLKYHGNRETPLVDNARD